MVYGMNTGYYNPYQYDMLNNTGYNNVQYGNNMSTPVLNGGVTKVGDTASFSKTKDNTADGKDDGSIGFWGATKNFVKGIGNFLTSPFKNEKGEWSLKSTFKSLAIGAAIAGLYMIPGVGPVLTPALLAMGTTAGVIGAGKAAYNIATAETDAQAEAAWQSMGSSTATIAASVIGAKNYAKGAAATNGVDASRYNGVKGGFRAVGRTFTDTGRNVRAGFNLTTAKVGAAYNAYKDGTLKTKVQAKYDAVKTEAQNAYKEVKNVARDVKTAASEIKQDWKALSTDEKKTVISTLKKEVATFAKQKASDSWNNRGQIVKDLRTKASKPEVIGFYTNMASQTVKPDFYSSLSKEEQAYFDMLPKEQREAIEEYYYSMV